MRAAQRDLQLARSAETNAAFPTGTLDALLRELLNGIDLLASKPGRRYFGTQACVINHLDDS